MPAKRTESLRELTRAAVADDRAQVKAMLHDQPGLATSDIPVLRACEAGSAAALAELVSWGSSIEAQPDNGGDHSRRPITVAARTKKGQWSAGHRACLEFLIQAGAYLGHQPSWNSLSALGAAAAHGNTEAIDILLYWVPLPLNIYDAAALAEIDRVEEALQEDPTLATSSSHGGGTALMNCAHSGLGIRDENARDRLVSTARLLLAAGAPLDHEVPGWPGKDALHLATWTGNHAVAVELAEADPRKDHVLTVAIHHQSLPVLDALEKMIARPGARVDLDAVANPRNGNSHLGEAIRWGRAKSALWLIDHGANVQARDRNGWTPLHYAAKRGTRPDVLLEMLRRGADPDAEAQGGATPRSVASERGKARVLETFELWNG